ncbi:unnamed protein product, partial [Discosporangium mesarthrocarpum]
ALLEGTRVLELGPKACREMLRGDPCPVPNGAAGLHLLGLACLRGNRRENAEEYFRLSLDHDPLMWISLQGLCELGVDVGVEAYYGQ